MKRVSTKSPLLIAGVVAGFALATVGGIAVAGSGLVTPAADGKIHVCYGTSSGSMRLVNKAASCRKAERRLVWNQKGITGKAGKAGSAGAKGAMGPAGAQGAVGPAGPIAGTPAGGDLAGAYPNPRLAVTEAPHVVGSPGAPAYGPLMGPYGQPPYGDLAYYRDPLGIVHLSGISCRLVNGSCAVGLTQEDGQLLVFTLPAGYRPAEKHVFTAFSFTSDHFYYTARVDVETDGSVKLVAPPSIGLDWISFENISFRAG